MSKDIMLFNACNHNVRGIQYVNGDCPLCLGNGYYYDMTFDNGKIVTCTGEIKLQQEVLKIMNDPKNGNKFFPDWGDQLVNSSLVGGKNTTTISQRMKMIIYETLQNLKSIQLNNQVIFANMTEDEIIEEILEIKITPVSQMSYVITVKFSNANDQIYEQTIVL